VVPVPTREALQLRARGFPQFDSASPEGEFYSSPPAILRLGPWVGTKRGAQLELFPNTFLGMNSFVISAQSGYEPSALM